MFGAPNRCAHFPTDICSVIQEGEITVEKCTHQGTSARWERHRLSLGQNKHGHDNSAPILTLEAVFLKYFPRIKPHSIKVEIHHCKLHFVGGERNSEDHIFQNKEYPVKKRMAFTVNTYCYHSDQI